MSGTALALAILVANGVSPEVEKLRACTISAVDPTTCIGSTVQTCIATSPDGETTAGMSACIGAEIDAWDAILNEEYQATMEASRRLDATGDVASADMTREVTLRAAQRAWIAFRDAHCAAEYARWGMGTMRQIAGANCVMVETAERAITLRQMRRP
jgi:uncharacterized protein YecT (DUF1311 family)